MKGTIEKIARLSSGEHLGLPKQIFDLQSEIALVVRIPPGRNKDGFIRKETITQNGQQVEVIPLTILTLPELNYADVNLLAMWPVGLESLTTYVVKEKDANGNDVEKTLSEPGYIAFKAKAWDPEAADDLKSALRLDGLSVLNVGQLRILNTTLLPLGQNEHLPVKILPKTLHFWSNLRATDEANTRPFVTLVVMIGTKKV